MSGGTVGQVYYNSEDPQAVPRIRQRSKVDQGQTWACK